MEKKIMEIKCVGHNNSKCERCGTTEDLGILAKTDGSSYSVMCLKCIHMFFASKNMQPQKPPDDIEVKLV